jgi:hypothetical protein
MQGRSLGAALLIELDEDRAKEGHLSGSFVPGPYKTSINSVVALVKELRPSSELIDVDPSCRSRATSVDLGHLPFVVSKPCLVSGRNRTHAHHLKFAQPAVLGRKVSDEFTVPLSRGIDARKVAEGLWRARRRGATVARGIDALPKVTSVG